MGERKELNKYYPADFDPAKIPRRRQPKNQQIKVQMMLPMSIQCNTCGNYLYKGTKFKENIIGETHLGRIHIFRFYFKCTKCSVEITIKIDPQNSNYVVKIGATRNFYERVENKKHKKNNEEMGDAVRCLENITLDSKGGMDILAALDELKSTKSTHTVVNVDAMLEVLNQEEKEKKLEEEDEAFITFRGSKVVRRIDDEDFNDEDFTDNKKTTKVSKDLSTTKTSVVDNSNIKASRSIGKFIFK